MYFSHIYILRLFVKSALRAFTCILWHILFVAAHVSHTGTMLVVFLCIMCLFITAVFSVVLCMRKVR